MNLSSSNISSTLSKSLLNLALLFSYNFFMTYSSVDINLEKADFSYSLFLYFIICFMYPIPYKVFRPHIILYYLYYIICNGTSTG